MRKEVGRYHGDWDRSSRLGMQSIGSCWHRGGMEGGILGRGAGEGGC